MPRYSEQSDRFTTCQSCCSLLPRLGVHPELVLRAGSEQVAPKLSDPNYLLTSDEEELERILQPNRPPHPIHFNPPLLSARRLSSDHLVFFPVEILQDLQLTAAARRPTFRHQPVEPILLSSWFPPKLSAWVPLHLPSTEQPAIRSYL